MTEEEKKLLLIDLCARLPYGVRVKMEAQTNPYSRVEFTLLPKHDGGIGRLQIWLETGDRYLVQPYLRPMSSMTEEEKEKYRNLSDEVIGSYGPYNHEFIAHCIRLGIKPDNPHECVDDFLNMEAIDWLLANHFDLRGLIPMGIALEAPEGMYKTE